MPLKLHGAQLHTKADDCSLKQLVREALDQRFSTTNQTNLANIGFKHQLARTRVTAVGPHGNKGSRTPELVHELPHPSQDVISYGGMDPSGQFVARTRITQPSLSPPWHPAGHANSIRRHTRYQETVSSRLSPRRVPTSLHAHSIIATFQSGLVAGKQAHRVLWAWATYVVDFRAAGACAHQFLLNWAALARHQSTLAAVAPKIHKARLCWDAVSAWRWFVRLNASKRLAIHHAQLYMMRLIFEVCKIAITSCVTVL
jgi:hypothetical protein